MNAPYYGKYRGTVVNNVDPQQTGRIQALVPDVTGVIPTTWALPCVPFAGAQQGIYVVPPIGSGVWIEYEQGDPDYPVWTGGFWGSAAEVPALALAGNPASPSIVLQSGLQNSITISDLPGPAGGIAIKSATGAMILVTGAGITITNGQASIVLAGTSVIINDGALAVT
ncbi:MAG: phage baseplate assembly protein V [Specibacter sp.]